MQPESMFNESHICAARMQPSATLTSLQTHAFVQNSNNNNNKNCHAKAAPTQKKNLCLVCRLYKHSTGSRLRQNAKV